MIYNMPNDGYKNLSFDEVEVHRIDRAKWGENEIIGIEDKYWDKQDPMSAVYDKKVEAEAKLITGIFKKDIKLVKEAVETGLTNILNGISVVLENNAGTYGIEDTEIFPITEAAKYSSPEIINYLAKIYNEKAQKSYIFMLPNTICSETEIIKTKAFDGKQAVIVPESKIKYIDDSYVNFDGKKIIGVVKSDGFELGAEILAKGVIEGNLDLVKLAVEKYNYIPTFNVSLVTEDKNELRLNTLYEAKKRNHGDILDYLQKAIAEDKKKVLEQQNKIQKEREVEFKNWLSFSNEYFKFDFPIKWESVMKLDKSILGIKKTNVNAGRPDYAIPIDESKEPQKNDLQILNEEKLIRGILSRDVEMVKSALESGTIEKNLVIGIVTYNPMCSKTRSFNAIQEALRKNNHDIISLLRNYQNSGQA